MQFHQSLRQIPVLARIHNNVGLLPYTFDDLQPVLVPKFCLPFFSDARLELCFKLSQSSSMLIIEQLLQGPSVIIKEALWGYASLVKHKLQITTREIKSVQGLHLVRVELLFIWINFGLLWRRQCEELEERAPLEHRTDRGIHPSAVLREFLLREDVAQHPLVRRGQFFDGGALLLTDLGLGWWRGCPLIFLGLGHAARWSRRRRAVSLASCRRCARRLPSRRWRPRRLQLSALCVRAAVVASSSCEVEVSGRRQPARSSPGALWRTRG